MSTLFSIHFNLTLTHIINIEASLKKDKSVTETEQYTPQARLTNLSTKTIHVRPLIKINFKQIIKEYNF